MVAGAKCAQPEPSAAAIEGVVEEEGPGRAEALPAVVAVVVIAAKDRRHHQRRVDARRLPQPASRSERRTATMLQYSLQLLLQCSCQLLLQSCNGH